MRQMSTPTGKLFGALCWVLLDISIATSSSAMKIFFGVNKFYPNSTIWFGSTNFCGEVAWNECSMFLMIRQIHKSHLVLKHSHHAQKITSLAKLYKISPKTSLHQAQQFVDQTNLWTLFINKSPRSIVSLSLSQTLIHTNWQRGLQTPNKHESGSGGRRRSWRGTERFELLEPCR